MQKFEKEPGQPRLLLPLRDLERFLEGFPKLRRSNSRQFDSTGNQNMKLSKTTLAKVVAIAFLGAPLAGFAADEKKADKPKPYTLKTCPVSGEKLDADPSMKSHSFVHGDREIKLCCKGCLKDFQKNAANYVKKIAEAEKKGGK